MTKKKTEENTLPLIIGITGTIGAGKGTVVEYLKEKGFAHHSVRKYLGEHLDKDALRTKEKPRKEYTRKEYQHKANYLRANHSEYYIMQQLYFRSIRQSDKNSIIESVRSVGEIKYLRSLQKEDKARIKILSIDALPEIRYQRIVARNSETDNVTYEEFLRQEQAELENKNPLEQNLLACIKKANYHIKNNGTIQELHESLDKKLSRIKLK